MSIWSEIRNTHFDDDEQKAYIDAYVTNKDGEEGKIIAKVEGTATSNISTNAPKRMRMPRKL